MKNGLHSGSGLGKIAFSKEMSMRKSMFARIASIGLLACSMTAVAQTDERPSDEDAGPAGVACIYPMKPFNINTMCDFMVYVEQPDPSENGTLVLLQKYNSAEEDGAMRVVDRWKIEETSQPHDVLLGSCGKPDHEDPSVLGLIKRSDEYVNVPHRMWTVNFQTKKFVALLNPGDFECTQGSGD